jgi:hypothetical protein
MLCRQKGTNEGFFFLSKNVLRPLYSYVDFSLYSVPRKTYWLRNVKKLSSCYFCRHLDAANLKRNAKAITVCKPSLADFFISTSLGSQ